MAFAVPRRVVPAGVWKCAVEPARDLILWHSLELLDRCGLAYDLRVQFPGLAELDEAVAAGSGVLLAGPHTRLSQIAVRHLRWAGYDVVAVSSSHGSVRRSPRGVPHIPVSPHFLVAVREALVQGRVVFAQIDHDAAIPGRTVEVHTAMGTLNVSDALLRLASRCRARTLFIASRGTPDGLECTIVSPVAESGSRPEPVGLDDFSRFLQGHVHGLQAVRTAAHREHARAQ
jgi:lauroyl/myristoyl acyltransferase